MGKLVKKKTLSHCPTPGATPSIFTMLHLNIRTKIPSMFQVCWLSGSKIWFFFKLPAPPKKKNPRKNAIFKGTPVMLTTYGLLGSPMPHTKFRSDRISGSGEEVSFTIFNKMPLCWPPMARQRPDFFNLQSTSCPNAPYQISIQSAQRFGRRSRKCKSLTDRHTHTHTHTHTDNSRSH